MKKVLSAVLVLVMCLAMATSVLAAEDDFVPSITYKGAPAVKGAVLKGAGDGEDVKACIVVTSILGAKNKNTDISQEERDELLSVYEKLLNGSMKLPLEGDYVIRELVDVSFAKTACREAGQEHDEKLNNPETTIELTFDLGIGAYADLAVFHYDDGQWKAVEAKNNGNGTVTCVFDSFCPVAFAVKNVQDAPSQTGDTFGRNMGLWIGLLVVSGVAVCAVVLGRRKIFG